VRFSVGDKVKFLNDVGSGTITGFTNDKVATVNTKDGFDIPVLINELIRDSENDREIPSEEDIFPRKETKNNQGQNQISAYQEDLQDNKLHEKTGDIMLALVPVDENRIHQSDIDLYIINDTNYYIFYLLAQQENVAFRRIRSGRLEPETKFFIHRYDQTAVSKIKNISLQLIYYGPVEYVPQLPENVCFTLEGIQFYKENNYKSNDYFDEKAVLFSINAILFEKKVSAISDDEILRIAKQKEKQDKPVNKIKESPGIEEIDLHIHEIVDDYAGLSNGEILNIQMSRFHTALEGAIINKIPKIVFIHGIGNGVLKHELRKTLDNRYPDLKYQDASFKEYGFGATLVVTR